MARGRIKTPEATSLFDGQSEARHLTELSANAIQNQPVCDRSRRSRIGGSSRGRRRLRRHATPPQHEVVRILMALYTRTRLVERNFRSCCLLRADAEGLLIEHLMQDATRPNGLSRSATVRHRTRYGCAGIRASDLFIVFFKTFRAPVEQIPFAGNEARGKDRPASCDTRAGSKWDSDLYDQRRREDRNQQRQASGS